ncbi:penicillin-binding transpeptidase domain-containing protein [Eubacterium sp. 1001713B170207_170306_E7]|uniref:penicillin-binding transpeptidase domain-containing protein n=1 Tax=Eubacterium sp. 1001713B170207_170306_E7 TaxID=2787097 RepID=UPI001899AF35|nr:penicillin-binding transpeptidase domain-containing protein [Eubacterium sp. 1001713B170207_170306_E7]
MKADSKKIKIAVGIAVLVVVIAALALAAYNSVNTPERALERYFKAVAEQDYDKMYLLISDDSKKTISREDFITRNKNIYEGIEARDLKLEVMSVEKLDAKQQQAYYNLRMETVAGVLANPGNVRLRKDRFFGEYRLVWNAAVILPGLSETAKVRVSTTAADRGSILDKDGNMLAGPGTAPSVGFVPGKINADTRAADLAAVAGLLGISTGDIEDALSASWVTDGIYVPVKTLPQIDAGMEAALLQIPGVMIGETAVRSYPYGEKAAHLTGYIGAITAEELEALRDEGDYRETSIVGKSGLEKVFDRQLRGKDGGTITVSDTSSDGIKTSRVLCESAPVKGSDVQTTINTGLQTALYDQLAGDKGTAAAINPKTGAVLALVSTPAYNPNAFILGMSDTAWESLSSSPDRPLVNRFEKAWAPGELIQPVTLEAGVQTGEEYTQQLKNLGFGETLPFDFRMEVSKISESGTVDGDLPAAGSGTAGMAATPLHLALIYSALVNDGSMVQPYIKYDASPMAQYWKKDVLPQEKAAAIRETLVQEAKSPKGRTMAEKTGTALQKNADNSGENQDTALCAMFYVDQTAESPLLVVAAAEDAGNRGGARYLEEKIRVVF